MSPSPVVVSLVRVPDGATVPDGSTVLDGSTFEEGELAWFRVLLSDGEGGPAPGGADVELSFRWYHNSPLVPTSGRVSRIVIGLPRVDVWDSFVSISENTVGQSRQHPHRANNRVRAQPLRDRGAVGDHRDDRR